MNSLTSLPARDAGVANWAAFLLMCLGMFMAILDVQIVAASLPSIRDALGIAAESMSWVQTAYLMAEVVAIPLTGLLTRALTLRWLFVACISVFTLASIGCAVSGGLPMLLAFRVLQGFAGGLLIPAVFSAVFLLFPERAHATAATIGGAVAVIAPTIGPLVGGWVTESWSWSWLFLINVGPGLLVAAATTLLLPADDLRTGELRALDHGSVLLLAAGLALLITGLKEAPQRGWLSPGVMGLLSCSCLTLAGMVWRTISAGHPVLALALLRQRGFAVGCCLSFCLGIGLFGSVYLMPVFLAFVRRHDALEIGTIMLVTGTSQLLAAPLAAMLEHRIGARSLAATGFALFALGLGLSAWQPRTADFQEMFWPQVIRGTAIMFCLLPPMRIALGALPQRDVADASAMFNLMRNLGGAIGIALVDTILFGRSAGFAEDLRDRLLARDVSAALAIGLDPDRLLAAPAGPPDAATVAFVRPMVERAALALSVNEAWLLLAVFALLGLLLVPLAGDRSAPAGSTG